METEFSPLGTDLVVSLRDGMVYTPGGGKSALPGRLAAEWLSVMQRGWLDEPDQVLTFVHSTSWLSDAYAEVSTARSALRSAADAMRQAETPGERREAVRGFLTATAELILCLLSFLVAVLLALLSRSLGRSSTDQVQVWQPEPIEESPQITPRGPNAPFPVSTYRGGHHRSALGSAVLAA
ncbi:hypothetical protein ABH930_007416 [Kitasatospora sp. GAS204A]|nr:hypothetical protein [Kitasatospora sp. GAS204B]